MRAATWNDEEDELLMGLPWGARLLYLQVLRRFMDDSTGMVGNRRGNRLTPRKIMEVLFVEPHQGLKDTGSPSRFAVRRLIQWLLKVGLIERRKDPKVPHRMVFFLPLAWAARQAAREEGAFKEKPAPQAVPPEPAQGAASSPKPAQNPPAQVEHKPAPQATPKPAPNPPTLPTSNAERFYARFSKGCDDEADSKEPSQPAPPSCDQNKPAPNPNLTRTVSESEPAPAQPAPSKASGPKPARDILAGMFGETAKAAPSSLVSSPNTRPRTRLEEMDAQAQAKRRVEPPKDWQNKIAAMKDAIRWSP